MSIAGGLQRHGALRAIAEALLDPQARANFGQITFDGFVASVLFAERDTALGIAHLIGEWEVPDGLDPAAWSSALAGTLPSTFGSRIVTSAQLSQNPAWAFVIEHWPVDAICTSDEATGRRLLATDGDKRAGKFSRVTGLFSILGFPERDLRLSATSLDPRNGLSVSLRLPIHGE